MSIHTLRSIAFSAFAGAILTTAAAANPLSLLAPDRQTPDQRVVQPMFEPQQPAPAQAARFKRQVVDYATHEAPGTIVIDTPNTYLYLVLGNGRALRSPVRPNPIAASVVKLVATDGPRLSVVGLDCLDGTPLLDLKPYFASTDAAPDAVVGWHARR